MLEIAQIVGAGVLLISSCWLFKGVAANALSCEQIPLSDQTVNIDGEHPSGFNIYETADQLRSTRRKHSVRAYVETLGPLSLVEGLHLR